MKQALNMSLEANRGTLPTISAPDLQIESREGIAYGHVDTGQQEPIESHRGAFRDRSEDGTVTRLPRVSKDPLIIITVGEGKHINGTAQNALQFLPGIDKLKHQLLVPDPGQMRVTNSVRAEADAATRIMSQFVRRQNLVAHFRMSRAPDPTWRTSKRPRWHENQDRESSPQEFVHSVSKAARQRVVEGNAHVKTGLKSERAAGQVHDAPFFQYTVDLRCKNLFRSIRHLVVQQYHQVRGSTSPRQPAETALYAPNRAERITDAAMEGVFVHGYVAPCILWRMAVPREFLRRLRAEDRP